MKEIIMIIAIGLLITAQVNKHELTLSDLSVHNDKAINYHTIVLDDEYKLLKYGSIKSTSTTERRGSEKFLPSKRVQVGD